MRNYKFKIVYMDGTFDVKVKKGFSSTFALIGILVDIDKMNVRNINLEEVY